MSMTRRMHRGLLFAGIMFAVAGCSESGSAASAIPGIPAERSAATGEEIGLPAGFPADFPLPQDFTVTAAQRLESPAPGFMVEGTTALDDYAVGMLLGLGIPNAGYSMQAGDGSAPTTRVFMGKGLAESTVQWFDDGDKRRLLIQISVEQ